MRYIAKSRLRRQCFMLNFLYKYCALSYCPSKQMPSLFKICLQYIQQSKDIFIKLFLLATSYSEYKTYYLQIAQKEHALHSFVLFPIRLWKHFRPHFISPVVDKEETWSANWSALSLINEQRNLLQQLLLQYLIRII